MHRRGLPAGRRAPIAAFAVAVAIAVSVGGCELMTATITPRPSRLVATPEPQPTPEPTEVDEVPTLRPDPSGSGPDLLDATDNLADLGSYRAGVASRGLIDATPPGATVTMSSIFVQTDNPAAEFSVTGVDGFAGGRLQAVVIGDRAWLKEGGAAWARSPGGAADFDAAFTPLSPVVLVGGFEALSGGLSRVGAERRNGVASIHYRVDASDAIATSAGLSAGQLDAWIAADRGYLVALSLDGTWDMDGTPTHVMLAIEVTRVDAATNRIVPPI